MLFRPGRVKYVSSGKPTNTLHTVNSRAPALQFERIVGDKATYVTQLIMEDDVMAEDKNSQVRMSHAHG